MTIGRMRSQRPTDTAPGPQHWSDEPPPPLLTGKWKGVAGRRHDPDTTPRRRCGGNRQARGAKTPSGTELLSDLSQILWIGNTP